MTQRIRWLVAATLLVGQSVAIAGQAPLPSALLDSTLVNLTSVGVDRGWLDRAAKEIQKIGRFELVNNREDAELVFILTRGASGDPFFVAGGNQVYSGTTKSARFIVQDPETNQLLWDDSRKIQLFVGGAVADLIKDLHKRIDEERTARQFESASAPASAGGAGGTSNTTAQTSLGTGNELLGYCELTVEYDSNRGVRDTADLEKMGYCVGLLRGISTTLGFARAADHELVARAPPVFLDTD